MKYIIMCGGEYTNWRAPRQLTKVKGEPIVARTIRLLKQYGVTDISITSNDPRFERYGHILKAFDYYTSDGKKTLKGYWVNAFCLYSQPCCYIFGDVVFSENAIKTIVETETDDIQFFASAPPFSKNYTKNWAEPFALKVQDTQHLVDAIIETKNLADDGRFARHPIMWELWQVIKKTPINVIDYTNYVVINDFTCDIDDPKDVARIEAVM